MKERRSILRKGRNLTRAEIERVRKINELLSPRKTDEEIISEASQILAEARKALPNKIPAPDPSKAATRCFDLSTPAQP